MICFIFASFYLIHFIFILWIDDTISFFWVLKNFDSKHTNEIFKENNVIYSFLKSTFFEVWLRKLSLSKIGFMDMPYMMDSGLNNQYTSFPNIFSLKSGESADLSHNQTNRIFQKISIFGSKRIWSTLIFSFRKNATKKATIFTNIGYMSNRSRLLKQVFLSVFKTDVTKYFHWAVAENKY